ncbi:hypothetical protein DIC82_14855 [Clostridium beijerinckii]|nr:hypothetical protein DIC82_14855 [Clostridium beijerinckii]
MKKNKLLKTLALTLAISSLGVLVPNSLSTTAYAEGQAYWQQINNSWYYMDSTGKARTGWVQDNGYWYYIGSDGVMKTGWIQDDGNWYYLWSNGQMATNTKIGGYYVNSSGAWTTSIVSNSSDNVLKPQDADGQHYRRIDISQSQRDVTASNQLTNYNVDMSSEGLRRMKILSINLAQSKTTIDEARSNCIGKVVDGKYKITDIKFFDQSFFIVNTGSDADKKVKAIQNSSLVTYKSSSSYKYDEFLVFSCGNARAAEWEAIRVVVEFEAV